MLKLSDVASLETAMQRLRRAFARYHGCNEISVVVRLDRAGYGAYVASAHYTADARTEVYRHSNVSLADAVNLLWTWLVGVAWDARRSNK